MYFARRCLRIFGAALFAAAAHAHAVVLDWSAVSWTPGSLSNSYHVDGYTHNGNDITIGITGNTNKLTTDPATGLAAPGISNSLEGGTGGDHSLILAGDLSTQTNFTVTVTFTGQYNAATEVSFKIFDIDMGTDREKILNIYGLLSDGVTKVAPTITDLGASVSGRNWFCTGLDRQCRRARHGRQFLAGERDDQLRLDRHPKLYLRVQERRRSAPFPKHLVV